MWGSTIIRSKWDSDLLSSIESVDDVHIHTKCTCKNNENVHRHTHTICTGTIESGNTLIDKMTQEKKEEMGGSHHVHQYGSQ